MSTGRLADIDVLCSLGGHAQQFGSREPVVYDHVGLGQHLGPTDRDQPGVTGSGTYEKDGHPSRLRPPPATTRTSQPTGWVRSLPLPVTDRA